MFVFFDESIRGLTEAQWADYALGIDHILMAHHRGGILLCLTPQDILLLRERCELGPIGAATLAVIQRRGSDYRAAAEIAQRKFQLCADGVLAAAFEIRGDGWVRMPLRSFAGSRCADRPRLFVEHVENDRIAVEMAFLLHCELQRYPANLVNIRASHGGGGTLADVLRALPNGALMGVCVCDRDCHPFSGRRFGPGGTACRAHEAAVQLGALHEGELGRSTRDPLFAFHVTKPRTIEAYIGPQLLDASLEARDLRAVRTSFIDAFPSFPNLGENEIRLWFGANFKSGTSAAELDGVLTASGMTRASVSADIDRVARLTIPNSASWIRENVITGRYKRALTQAFERDCSSLIYEEAVSDLSMTVWDILAGDNRMMTA